LIEIGKVIEKEIKQLILRLGLAVASIGISESRVRLFFYFGDTQLGNARGVI
jgi:hypothetical protein